jgi:hypothetical protein
MGKISRTQQEPKEEAKIRDTKKGNKIIWRRQCRQVTILRRPCRIAHDANRTRSSWMAGRDKLLAGNFQKAGGHGWRTGELDLQLWFRRAWFRDEVANSMGWFLAEETDPWQVVANRETAAL